jgi:putative addiction module killer protein
MKKELRLRLRYMYYLQRGDVLIVMLGGGDKSTQPVDIAKAIAMAKELKI